MNRPAYHPTFLHARREFYFIVAVWACCLIWSVPYCYLTGYMAAGESVGAEGIPTVWGIPRWVFFGIFLPWLLADVVTTWFCFVFMCDDDLGENEPSESMADHRSDDDGEDRA